MREGQLSFMRLVSSSRCLQLLFDIDEYDGMTILLPVIVSVCFFFVLDSHSLGAIKFHASCIGVDSAARSFRAGCR